MERGWDWRRGHHEEVGRRVCLLCQEKLELDHEGSGTCLSGESGGVGGSSLKSLFRYLKVEVSKVPLGTRIGTGAGDHLREDCCWTEEELVASSGKICGECDLLVELFGVQYKAFEAALRYMKHSIQKLEERLKLNDCNPGATPGPGDDGLTKYYNLKAEIMKMCELKLKLKPSDEELPGGQQRSDIAQEEQQQRSSSNHARKRQSTDEQRANNGVWTVWRRQSSDDVDEVEGGNQLMNDDFHQEAEGQSEDDQMEGAPVGSKNSKLDENQIASGKKTPRVNGKQRKSSVVSQKKAGSSSNSGDSTSTEDVLIMNNSLEGDILKQGKDSSTEDGPPTGPPPPLVRKVHSNEPQEEPLVEDHDMPEPLSSTSTTTHLLETAASSRPEVMEHSTGVTSRLIRKRLRVKPNLQLTLAYFKSKQSTKPPFSTASLIKRAIRESQNKGLTLDQIFDWFHSNFAYFNNNKSTKITTAKLKKRIASTLSSRECFTWVELLGGLQGAWKVRDWKFYKSSVRKLSGAQSKSGKSASNISTVNLKTGVSGVSNLVEPSSSRDLQLPHSQRKQQENVQNEVGGGGASVGTSGSEALSLSPGVTTFRNCLYCGVSLRGGKSNLDRHMTCVHSTEHVPALTQLGTNQSSVNNVVMGIGMQNIITCSAKRKAFRCTLCGDVKERSGDSKHHILKEHLPVVLERLRTTVVGSSAAPVVSNFNESQASSDLLQNHINQESSKDPMESAESGQAATPSVPHLPPPSKKHHVQGGRRRLNVKSEFQSKRVYWRSADVEPPPFTRAFLIRQAINESRDKQLTEAEICTWITNSFRYFRTRSMTKLENQVNQTLLSCNNSGFARVDTGTGGGVVWRVSRNEKKGGEK